MNTKNATRIASLLGTWTGQTHLKTDIGSYELSASFVIHLMPDPTRGYGCTLPDCNEVKNQVCLIEDGQDESGFGESVCENIAGNIVDWSDVVAFYHFGARVDVGFPFNKHRGEDTGGWVGPINIILAQDESTDDSVVDRYVARYVESPTTDLLRVPANCTLFGKDDFTKTVGAEAVRNTAAGQYSESDTDDPYAQYLKTCDNGDVKPMLPLFEFDFVKADSGEEEVEVNMAYKFMTMPRKKDFMYDMYPTVQKRFNKAGMGFHISGPYCYGNDANRGYTFDMNFDTRDPKKMIKLEHNCIEGLPCLPPAAQLYQEKDGADIHVHPAPDDATTVNVGSTLYFIAIIMVLGLGLVVSLRTNFRMKRELVRQIESPSPPHTVDDVDQGIINNEQDDILSSDSTETENNLETPLLSQKDEITDEDNVV